MHDDSSAQVGRRRLNRSDAFGEASGYVADGDVVSFALAFDAVGEHGHPEGAGRREGLGAGRDGFR